MSEQAKSASATIYVCYVNHFDLIWRRGWKRGYEHLGLFYRPYADLEEAIITRCLKLALQQGAAFQLEQALSLREYLARHPDALPAFQALARQGRFELLGGGEAIIDVNMCSGETMARNWASGARYARHIFGKAPVIAAHNDGFGSSAQLPQVARLCGMKGINGLSYSQPDGPYWRGLDGSTVLVEFPAPGQGFWYDHCYYEPCLTCRGYGRSGDGDCPDCEGTGLRLSQGIYPPREWAQGPHAPLEQYIISSEEMMPDEQLPALVVERNRQVEERYVWGTQSALMPLWEEALNRVDEPDVELSSRVENNPAQTGTYVSRIRIKQAARRAEGWFYTAEKLAALSALAAGKAPPTELNELWLRLPLIFFHDAITGTHNDPAFLELLDMAQGVVEGARRVAAGAVAAVMPDAEPVLTWQGEGYVAVFNPHSFSSSIPVEVSGGGGGYAVSDAAGNEMPVYRQPAHADLSAGEDAPVGPGYWRKRGQAPPATLRFLARDVPPLGMKVFRVRPRPAVQDIPLADSVELAGYRVGWDENGVRSIVELQTGQELLNADGGPLGHLILEEDIGDPWGTRSLQRGRTCCAEMTKLLGAYRRGDAAEVVFAGKLDNGPFGREKDPCTFGLQWYETVRLLEGVPWVEFDLDIFWQSANRRVRVVFPSRSRTDEATYKIPYGVLRRGRYEMKDTCLWCPNGDWPATYFVATEPDGSVPGLAVFNTGTPSVRVEDGKVMYSVLRSPGFGFCLMRYAQEYPMPLSEMCDGGHHSFRFALMPHTGENLARLLEVGYLLNTPAPAFRAPAGTEEWVSGLAVAERGVYVTSVKFGYEGGVAVRLVEQLGLARTVTVSLPEGVAGVRTSNLLEEPQAELSIQEGSVRVPLRPFEICTLLFQYT